MTPLAQKTRLLLGGAEEASLPADLETESIDSDVKKARPNRRFTLTRGNAQAAPTKKLLTREKTPGPEKTARKIPSHTD